MKKKSKSYLLSAIGDAVKVWRKQMGMTQAKASELCGLNISQFQRLERGIDVNLSTFLAVWEQMTFSLSGADVFPINEYFSVYANVPSGLDGARIKDIAESRPR